MKVLFVGLARSLWLFDFNMFNPKGLNPQPALEEIGKRYQFAKVPRNMLDFDENKGLPFKAGTFVNSKGISLLVSFTIYLDGFVADTASSTDDSTEFLVDVTGWLGRDFGFVVPAGIKKAWVSQIDFECDLPFTDLNPALTKIVKFLESHVKAPDSQSKKFDLGGLHFWTEDITKPGAPATVKFERKYQTSFSDHHYFSQAPLQTQDHEELLLELEKVLRS